MPTLEEYSPLKRGGGPMGWWERACGCLVFVIFLTNTDVYFDLKGVLPIASSLFFAICATAGLLWGLLRGDASLVGWGAALIDRKTVFLPLVLIGVLSLVGAFGGGARMADGGKYIFLPVFDIGVLLAATLLGMLMWVNRCWWFMGSSAVLVLVLTISWDLIVPGSFSNQLARGGGLGVNPNSSAFFVVYLTATTLSYSQYRLRDIAVIALGSIGVLCTLSRAGILLQFVLINIYLTKVVVMPLLRGDKAAAKAVGSLTLSLVIVAAGFGAVVRSSPMFADFTAKNRVAMLIGQRSVVNSDESRVKLLVDYMGLICRSPIVGRGPGFVARQEKGPHNMFLYMWVEKGALGLLAYLGWLGGCAYYFRRKAFTMGLVLVILAIIQSMFSHNLMDYRVFLIATGIALGMADRGVKQPKLRSGI